MSLNEKNNYKCLLIGLGQRSIDDHIPALIPNVLGIELVAVCDVDPTKKKLMKKLFIDKEIKSPRFYNNLDQACKKESPNFAIVSTPHNTHLQIAQYLLEHNIPFLKEKPFAFNLQQAYLLHDLVKKHKGYMRVCVQRRNHPLYIYGKKALIYLGDIRRFEARYQLHANAYYTGWRSTPKDAGGGCVMDMGYHYLDLLYWYFGSPEIVYSVIGPKSNDSYNYSVEETALISLKYQNGMVGNLFLSLCENNKSEELFVYGKYGYIHLQRDSLKRFNKQNELVESLIRSPAWPSAVSEVLMDFLENFKNPIIVKKECRNSIEIMKIIHAIYESIKHKTSISLKDIRPTHL